MPTKLSRFCEGIMEAGWLLALLLVPMFFNIYSSRIFEPDKLTLLRSLALIILAAWIVKLIDEGGIRWNVIQPGEAPVKTFLRFPLLGWVAGLALLYVILTIFSVTPRISLWGSYQRLQGTYTTFSYIIIFASIIANLRRRAQVERLITAAILCSLPIGLYAILQRYKIDPVPWGGNTSIRVAGNLGNSIFIAAYMLMVIPLTIGRIIEAFTAILRDQNGLGRPVVRATLYVFIFALQLITMFFSGSRGPTLGWMVSMVALALLLAFYWRKRVLAAIFIGLSALLIVFLFLFQLPGGPLESLRQAPGIGRFSLLLDAESNSAKVRKYIWQGAFELVKPHDPLVFPDGSGDRFNVLRPLIGYGPESMYVAYNQFYVPELGQVEKRNASPDRSHNETWDAMVQGGLLGLVIYLGLFISVFYYGLKWIGLIPGPKQRWLFLAAVLGGAAVGAVGMSIWREVSYIGLGIPFGIMAGVIGYIALATVLLKPHLAESPGEKARLLVLIVLLAAIFGHFAEINFGIAIASTRTYFWTYAGLLLVIGYILPKTREYEVSESAAARAETAESESTRQDKRQARARRKAGSGRYTSGKHPWLNEALAYGLITGVIVITLGYNYLTNPAHSRSTLEVIWNSLTTLPKQNNATSYGILALVLFTWLISAVLWTAESRQKWAPMLQTILGVSFATGFVFWLFHAGALTTISGVTQNSLEGVLGQINRVGNLLTTYYAFVILSMLGAAFFLPVEFPGRTSTSGAVSWASAAGLTVLAIALISYTNLRIIRADIVFKSAEPFNTTGQWPVATELYKQAHDLAPSEDHYYLFLGRSYLEQAKEAKEVAEQERLVNESAADLKVAQKINPLNTDHTANLARLYSWWSGKTTDAAARTQRAQQADAFYERALKLSPQNSTLWGEWAILESEVLNNKPAAYEKLEHAMSLDPLYSWTQSLLGDYYYKLGKTLTDTEKTDAYTQAIDYYTKAVSLARYTEVAQKIGYLVSLGNLYTEVKDYDKAIESYSQAIANKPKSSDLWRIEETIARLYGQKGDKQNAMLHANNALQAAPDETSKARVQQLIDQINQLP